MTLTIDGAVRTSTGGSGDVQGPGSSVDNAIVRFDSTTGQSVQGSPLLLDDNGDITSTEREVLLSGPASKRGLGIPPMETEALATYSPVQAGVVTFDSDLAKLKVWTGAVWDTFITNSRLIAPTTGRISLYGGSVAHVFNSTSDVHGVKGVSTSGTLVRTTAVASSDYVVSAVADNGSGKMRCTAAGHNFAIGDYVVHTNFTTAGQRGVGLVTYASGDDYDVDITYSADETGRAVRPSGLKISTGGGGVSRISLAYYLQTASATATTHLIRVYVNKTAKSNLFGYQVCTTSLISVSASCTDYDTLSDGDFVWLGLVNFNNTSTATLVSANLNIQGI